MMKNNSNQFNQITTSCYADEFFDHSVLQKVPGEGVQHELINRVDKLRDR
jgi:hypothetical protein